MNFFGGFDAHTQLREVIAARRNGGQAYAAADEMKAAVCNDIQAEKRKWPGLTQRIAALEESDPEMWKFIRGLEYINQGVWCTKCGVAKAVPDATESFDRAATRPSQLRNKAAEFKKIIADTEHQLAELEAHCTAKIDEFRELLRTAALDAAPVPTVPIVASLNRGAAVVASLNRGAPVVEQLNRGAPVVEQLNRGAPVVEQLNRGAASLLV